MATAIKMPQLGVTMTEAKIVSWLKREGETVRKGETVATIETDKINAEVEATADGVLRRIVSPEGAVVPVVGLMGVIARDDEPDEALDRVLQGQGQGPRAATGSQAPVTTPQGHAQKQGQGAPARLTPPQPALPQPAGRREEARAAPGPAAVADTGVTAPAQAAMEGEVRASPIARRLAADMGVNLTHLRGSGPGGRIVEADVRAAAEMSSFSGGASASDAAPSASPASSAVTGSSVQVDGQPSTTGDSFTPVTIPVTDGPTVFKRASPLARRLAREHGLDLHAIRGTGPADRVVERDVLTAVEVRSATGTGAAIGAGPDSGLSRPSVLPAGRPAGLTPRETIPLDGMRRLIAQRLQQSLQESAQLTVITEADATALVELRGHLLPAARIYGHRQPTYTDILVYLVARALQAHPRLNSSLLGQSGAQEIVCWSEINIGVAVALEAGLVVPVIRRADQKPLQSISHDLADMVERARASRLAIDDLQSGTFTITNLGAMEVDAFTPIVNPPQCAILGVGRIAKQPAVHGDLVVARHMVTLSLSFDHRIVDGAPAGAFLRDVKRAIEAAGVTPGL